MIKKKKGEIEMKKLIIGITILFLLIGIVSATQFDDLKAPDGFEGMMMGTSMKNGDAKVSILVDKQVDNPTAFQNVTDSLSAQTVTPLGDHIYKFTDSKLNCRGVVEAVTIDGIKYVVWFEDDNGADGSVDDLLSSLKEFNSVNGLQPIAP